MLIDKKVNYTYKENVGKIGTLLGKMDSKGDNVVKFTLQKKGGLY